MELVPKSSGSCSLMPVVALWWPSAFGGAREGHFLETCDPSTVLSPWVWNLGYRLNLSPRGCLLMFSPKLHSRRWPSNRLESLRRALEGEALGAFSKGAKCALSHRSPSPGSSQLKGLPGDSLQIHVPYVFANVFKLSIVPTALYPGKIDGFGLQLFFLR